MTSSTPPKGHSFVVYIDEAGDEGFKLGEGSSEWFVLSAVVIRSDLELETVKLVDDVRRLIKVADAHPLHFRNLKHERRLPFVERIAAAQLRTVTILAHKPSIRGSTLPVRPRLYFYCSRILFERLSWFCRDSVLAPGMAGCRAKIVFSHRSSTPYSELREYVRLLRDGPRCELTKVHWPSIDVDGICSLQHQKSRGLQIADAVSSSYFAAVSTNSYGFTEDRYVRMLRPVTYSYYTGKCPSYGIKFLPGIPHLTSVESRFAWYRERYEK